jgi:hypothetical protein
MNMTGIITAHSRPHTTPASIYDHDLDQARVMIAEADLVEGGAMASTPR